MEAWDYPQRGKKMKPKVMIFLLVVLVGVGGCATVPRGPSVRVLPGPGKTFDQFQADDAVCRQWAEQHIGESPQETVNQNTVTGAAVGTAAGAILGAAIGSASGRAGTGAAIGAGSGLLLGTATGAGAGQEYGMEAQRRYDIAYEQCMYAKGNQIPGVKVGPPAPVSQAVPPPPPPAAPVAEAAPSLPPPPAPVAEAGPPPPPPPASVVEAGPPPPPPTAPVVVSPGPPRVVFGAAPRFIYSPALGFYVAVETPYDLVFDDGRYYLWSNGFWYAAPYYNGPWVSVQAGRLPPRLHRFRYEEIRRHRDLEYHAYLRDKNRYHGRWYVPEERREHR
jgi:hypothetical protein